MSGLAEFHRQIAALSDQLAGRPLDQALQDWMNQTLGRTSETYCNLLQSCQQGIGEGWACNREAGGIRYGRVFKPEAALNGLSVDLVDMDNVTGPQHCHPRGEIDLVMPIEGDALFDGNPAGWVVYPPGSIHCPTVSNGRALVLYLLPDGSIEFVG